MNHEKRNILKAFALNFALGLLLVLTGFVLGHGTFYLGHDFNYQQIPFHQMAADAVRSGEWLWLDSFDLGTSTIGALSFYVLGSPFFWVTLLLPHLNYVLAVPFLFPLKFAVAGTAAYCYARQYIRKADWALLAGMLYAFSGYQLGNMNYNHFLDVTALFPLLLLALDQTVVHGKRGWFALAVALCALTNYFFFVAIVVFLLLYFCVKTACGEYKLTLPLFGRLAFESLIGVGISMVLLLPNIFFVLGNPRVSSSLFHSELARMLFLKPHQLADLLHAMLLPAESIFNRGFILTMNPTASELYLPVVGIIPAAAWLLNHRKSWFSRLSVVCLLFMLIPILNSSFTAFNVEYYARWFFMPLLLLAVMTGMHFEQQESIRRGMIVWGILAGLFLVARLLWKYYFHVEFFPNKLLAMMLMAIAAAGVLVVLFADHWKAKPFLPALLITAIFVQTTICFALNTYYTHKAWNTQQLPADVFLHDVPNMQFPADETYYRFDASKTYINTGVWTERPSISQFGSNITGSIFEFYTGAGLPRSVNSFLPGNRYGYETVLGSKYMLVPQGTPLPAEMQGFSAGPVWTNTGFDFYENENFIGMGYASPRALPAEEFAKLSPDQRHLAMVDAIVLDEDLLAQYSSLFDVRSAADYQNFTPAKMALSAQEKRPSAAQNFQYAKGSYQFDVTLPQDTLYYVSVPFDNGFTAQANGKTVAVEKVNNGMIGLPLSTGENHVVLSYMPLGLKAGIVLSVLSLVCLTGDFILRRRKENETKKKAI